MFKNTFKDSKVLITGHTGFKGSWLAIWLETLGADVYGISKDIPSEPCHFEVGKLNRLINDYRLDICELEAISSIMLELKPDFVFHLAAQPLVRQSYDNPIETWQSNTLGTLNILQSLRKIESNCVATFITSDKCYDNVEWEWGYRETDRLGGPDPYSASKGAAELAIRSYVKSFFSSNDKIRIGIGRAGNVIGGGDWAEDRIVPDCVRAASIGDHVAIRNPEATRPWQHVLEPLSGYLSLAAQLKTNPSLHGEAFNFGPPSNQNHTVKEVISLMSDYWSSVKWKDASSEEFGPMESSLLKLNCDKALHHLDWQANWDFFTTIEQTTNWYRNFYENHSSAERILDYSIQQIKFYTEAAKSRGFSWVK